MATKNPQGPASRFKEDKKMDYLYWPK